MSIFSEDSHKIPSIKTKILKNLLEIKQISPEEFSTKTNMPIEEINAIINGDSIKMGDFEFAAIIEKNYPEIPFRSLTRNKGR